MKEASLSRLFLWVIFMLKFKVLLFIVILCIVYFSLDSDKAIDDKHKDKTTTLNLHKTNKKRIEQSILLPPKLLPSKDEPVQQIKTTEIKAPKNNRDKTRKLSKIELLKRDFFHRQKTISPTKKSNRDSFSIQSVFERELDPKWSEQAVEHLYQLINSYPKQYKLAEKVTSVTCSDVMCAVLMIDGKGLSREKMRIHFLQNGGFPVFSVISDRDDFNGFYLPRFDREFGDANLIQVNAEKKENPIRNIDGNSTDKKTELLRLEILKTNVLKEHSKALSAGKSSFTSYHIQSVFERELDPKWSDQAIEHLYQLINSYPKQYKLQEKVTGVTCSDVMCAVLMTDGKGLSKEKMRIHFLQNGGFNQFYIVNKRVGYNGFYLSRFAKGFKDADLIQKKSDD